MVQIIEIGSPAFNALIEEVSKAAAIAAKAEITKANEVPIDEPDWLTLKEAIIKTGFKTRSGIKAHLIEDGEPIKGKIRFKKIRAKCQLYNRQDCENFKNRYN